VTNNNNNKTNRTVLIFLHFLY